MDNLAHTLAGIALGEAGLKRTTALGTATLAIAANLPDIDALTYLVASDVDALAFRRGWTHGILAMLVLPVALAILMKGFDRAVRRRKRLELAPAKFRMLLLLSAIGVWSHPLLDLLNVYGVRLLMPFSDRWFYGDALFIIDPWLWLALAVGIALARRRERRELDVHPGVRTRWVARPARLAILGVTVYAVAMALSSQIGESIVARDAGRVAQRTMVAPVPVNALRREVVRDFGDTYELGLLELGVDPRYVSLGTVPRGDLAPLLAAAETEDGRKFLTWARFPRALTHPRGDSLLVHLVDVRYGGATDGETWAATTVLVPR